MSDYARLYAPPPPPVGNPLQLPGRAGAGDSLLLAGLWQQTKRPILFLASDPATAAHVAEECAFFAPEAPLRFLPDWGCLPFDRESPPLDLQSERISALAAFRQTPSIVIAAASTALLPCPPPAHIAARAFQIKIGKRIRSDILIDSLIANGYARVDRVLAAGEFAMYGGQVDIYPPGAVHPCRLVLFDDEIEEIRLFDTTTQRSIQTIQQAEVLPPGECDMSADGIARFCENYRRRFAEIKDADGERVCNGESAPGMEFYLPLFFDTTARLHTYAPDNLIVVLANGCQESLEHFMQQAQRRQKNAELYEGRAVLSAEEVFLPPAELFAQLSRFSTIELCGKTQAIPPAASMNYRRDYSHAALAAFLSEARGDVVITAAAEGRLASLCASLKNTGITVRRADSFAHCIDDDKNANPNISAAVANLRGGFADCGLTLLTEAEIFDIRPRPARRRRLDDSLQMEELAEGQLVVHRDYGIGRYLGMQDKTIGGESGEFLCIEYASQQRLWLPIAHLHLLLPHGGGRDELSTLGSTKWRRAHARAAKQARDTAARLLDIHARRNRADGISHIPDAAVLARFADGFPFAETADQTATIDSVLADMRSPRPMDRLLAADVGFGKTEVAMRAACAAALSGYQTALLAPTTLLAEQHAQTFAARFAGFPVRLASLNRLSIGKKKTLADLATGRIDIVIGTHALLQPAVQFHRLGLLIIDEEHRFGVRQKEYFKSLRANIDVLAMSATPIPRTMGMALEGLRTLSIINTPPPLRLPVRTTVAPFSRELILDACERELLRSGQIYFVHNDIGGLPAMEERLQEWLPSMRIVVAHGSMPAAAIERAMRRFVRRDADMLLCTVIIESGLDIASTNTIIINRADRMGISRLHQLRGRVGRADVQAHALLLVPQDGASQTAKSRLHTLSAHARAGGGLALALRDLEIRGMGEILGERQSGDIAAVGTSLYQRMLNTAVRQLESGAPEVAELSVVELPAAALLPADYVHSAAERLRYYRALSACANESAVSDIRLEWEDRFGRLPPLATNLMTSHRLRLQAAAAGVLAVRPGRNSTAHLQFMSNPATRDNLLSAVAAGACRVHRDGKTIVLENMPDDASEWAEKTALFLRDLQVRQTPPPDAS